MAGHNVIKPMNPTLKWLSDLLSFFSGKAITIPSKYRDQVLNTKKLLKDDVSGLVNSLLDYAINAVLVDYTIETDNEKLTEFLNEWLRNINVGVSISIPSGLNALAKEYYRERWKGSSNLLLRTFWNRKNGFYLPDALYFVDGEDIKVKHKDRNKRQKNVPVRLGEEEYYLRIDSIEDHDVKLPRQENELIFTQRPFETWGTFTPTPFIIRRGLYRNLSFLKLMSEKGEDVIKRALQYLFVMKKGNKELALSGRAEFTYSGEDLKGASEDLKKLIEEKKSQGGLPSYTTNFDTEIEHLIPEYEKVMKKELYEPIERKIMAGLGLVDILQGVGSTRRESTVNPKPFIAEAYQGVVDFKALIMEIIRVMVAENKKNHPKWMGAKIKIKSKIIKEFQDDKTRVFLRSVYDRGNLDNRNFIEGTTNFDYEEVVRNRKQEKKEGIDKVLYPPVIQNLEQQEPNPEDTKTVKDPDKIGPEKKNFKNAKWEDMNYSYILPLKCSKCGYEDDLSVFLDTLIHSDELDKIVSICPGCGEELQESDIELTISKDLEKGKIVKKKDGWHVLSKDGKNLGGPYKTKKEAEKRLKSVEYWKHKNK